VSNSPPSRIRIDQSHQVYQIVADRKAEVICSVHVQSDKTPIFPGTQNFLTRVLTEK
jgi:hypothetical protein